MFKLFRVRSLNDQWIIVRQPAFVRALKGIAKVVSRAQDSDRDPKQGATNLGNGVAHQ